MDRGEIVVASNRGPVSFVRDPDGPPVARRGVGGLVASLIPALQRTGGLWVAAAMTELDREVASAGRLDMTGLDWKFAVRYLSFDPVTYDRYYNGISNRVLWFLHHYLWDLPRNPRFGAEAREAWAAYREVNEAFAEALAEEAAESTETPSYLVQDYHLSLVPAMLRHRRRDASVAHFSHIPFAGPTYLRILPTEIREELLAGLLGSDLLGFHTGTWADRFLLSARALGARVDLRRRLVRWDGREVRVGVYPISADAEGLWGEVGTEEVTRAAQEIEAWRGDAKLILRVDRAELSKNVLRGFLAYEELLRSEPRRQGRVRFLALLNPSRQDVPEYRAYIDECLRTAERINSELAGGGWEPIQVELKNDLPRAVAGYLLYDVLLVNPVFDGMNLVAKEGPLVNRTNGVLILSENAGAFEEIGRHAISVNPFDVAQTAEALAAALDMDERERRRRARALRRAVERSPLNRWVERQLGDLEAVRGLRRA